MARQGVARRGLERIGMAGAARRGEAWLGMERFAAVRHGRNGTAHRTGWHGMASGGRHGDRRGLERPVWDWLGGAARRGEARDGAVCNTERQERRGQAWVAWSA